MKDSLSAFETAFNAVREIGINANMQDVVQFAGKNTLLHADFLAQSQSVRQQTIDRVKESPTFREISLASKEDKERVKRQNAVQLLRREVIGPLRELGEIFDQERILRGSCEPELEELLTRRDALMTQLKKIFLI